MKSVLCRIGAFVQKTNVAESFSSRLFGMLLRDPKKDAQPLYFPFCNSIHTIGMRHPLDLIFINEKKGVVARVDRGVSAGKLWVHCAKADGVLEIFSDYANHSIKAGDQVLFEALP